MFPENSKKQRVNPWREESLHGNYLCTAQFRAFVSSKLAQSLRDSEVDQEDINTSMTKNDGKTNKQHSRLSVSDPEFRPS